ncbi:hypothetical protein [Marinigracilibium pacificum]|uniref:Uncharacterized protein n=1 Tax=Marinigracilibium pacificum TaxID=2729599 RepID=A0A848IWK4_9BACT|nr:hypothetical protein [Marinigracilibium pacificum]NMM48903.1 hypothetical protein [Marinigracilibium pacificum]
MKNIFNKKKELLIGAFFGSSEYEMKNLLCGIGESEILRSEIKISKYPFEPSSIFPEKVIVANEISAISWNSYPPLIRIDNEVIFISREYSDQLRKFAVRNKIQTFEATRNWDWLLEPYVDTEYTDETDQRLRELLENNGILNEEIDTIRNEVKKQMFKYNFDTMLWDWGGLGLSDVLAAMRVKYNKEQFADFYKRAMEIQLRTK